MTGKRKFNVVHLTEGVRWAGMESHLYNLLPSLKDNNNVDVLLMTFFKGQIVDKLRKKLVKTQVLDKKRKFDLNVIKSLVKSLSKNKTEIVHMHGYLSIIYGIPAALLARVPIRIVTLHATPLPDVRGWQRYKLHFVLRFSYMLISITNTKIIAVSDDIANSYKNIHGQKNTEVTVIHNGIFIDEVIKEGNKTQAVNEIRRKCIIGIIGRIDENKGHIFFIKAAELLLSQGFEAEFWILGTGPLEQSLREYCRKSDFVNHIKFFGFKEDILNYLSQLDVLIISSFHEGIPYTMLEAMALKVPVVATSVGGMKEVIENSVNGFLVPVKNSKEIANRVKDLVNDRDLKMRISEAALKTLRERFSASAMASRQKNFYDSCLDSIS